MKNKNRIIKALIFALAFSMLPIGSVAAASMNVNAYSGEAAAIQISENIGVMGMRVKLKVPVTGVGFSMPTWSVSGKYSAYISAYEWKGSYSATVSAEPFPSFRTTRQTGSILTECPRANTFSPLKRPRAPSAVGAQITIASAADSDTQTALKAGEICI